MSRCPTPSPRGNNLSGRYLFTRKMAHWVPIPPKGDDALPRISSLSFPPTAVFYQRGSCHQLILRIPRVVTIMRHRRTMIVFPPDPRIVLNCFFETIPSSRGDGSVRHTAGNQGNPPARCAAPSTSARAAPARSNPRHRIHRCPGPAPRAAAAPGGSS
jgi:hypothetical protein